MKNFKSKINNFIYYNLRLLKIDLEIFDFIINNTVQIQDMFEKV